MLMDIIRKIPAAKLHVFKQVAGRMLLRQIFQGITGAGVFKIFQVCGKGAARTFQDGILKKQASKISGFAGQSAKGRKLAGPQFFKPQQQVLAQKRIPG